ncbi:MAG: CHAT domain-containing protein [Cyanobacteria bacterium P01_H01_bin.21]
MARKRRLLFYRVHSFLKGFNSKNVRRQLLWILAGATLTFALASAPVLSQPSDDLLAAAPEQQFHQGQTAYQAQNYSAAVTDLNQAIEGFAAQDNVLAQAIALGNLSLSHQALRQWSMAEDAIKMGLALLDMDYEQLSTGSIFDRLNSSNQYLAILAPLLDIDGQLLFKQGEFDAALNRWQAAAKIYEKLQDTEGLITNQTRQIQTLQSSGLYGQAGAISDHLETQLAQILTQTVDSSQTIHRSQDSPPLLLSRTLLSLGDTYRSIGQLTCSKEILEHLAIAQGVSSVASQQNTDEEICSKPVLEQLTENSLVAVPEARQNYPSNTLLSLGKTHLAIGIRERERQTSVSRQNQLPWACPTPISDTPKGRSREAQNLHAKLRTPYEAAGRIYLHILTHETSPRERMLAQQTLLDASLALKNIDAFGDVETVQQQWHQAYATLADHAAADRFMDRFGVYAHIKLARQGVCLLHRQVDGAPEQTTLLQILNQAISIAKKIDDDSSLSQALGSLGSFYEYLADQTSPSEVQSTKLVTQQSQKADSIAKALTLTNQALITAQPYNFPDIAYQWQWQLGRLYKNADQPQQAIASYQQAVATLSSVRNNLLVVDSEVQFSFRDNVEPVYRELADLLLSGDNVDKDSLKQVVGLIDNIQLSELESFLQCNLQGTATLTNADFPTTSAIIYTILLNDRLEVIYQTEQPDQEEPKLIRGTPVNLPIESINLELAKLRNGLQRGRSLDRSDPLENKLKTVYGWLIGSYGSIFQQQGIDTLVFVLDGELRNIPMAALQNPVPDNNGNYHYLVEDFATALTPRLQIEKPKRLSSRQPSTLFFGLPQMPDFEEFPTADKDLVSRFKDLDAVIDESRHVERFLPDSTILLNDKFDRETLEKALTENPVSIVHFATHGKFSSDPEQTFILAWDSVITSNDLYAILEDTPVDSELELLILNACKTATGDNRATLGIAGLALKAGAQSTLASLWSVSDEATAKFSEYFYQAITSNQTISRAQAVQQAQLQLKDDLDREYPGPESIPYWSPYILVGNWL